MGYKSLWILEAAGNWELEIMDGGGTVIVARDIPNAGMNFGNEVQAGGELYSITGFNELGEADLLDLKWRDQQSMWHYWDHWDGEREDCPYELQGIERTPYEDIRISGRNSEPIPPYAPCP